MIGGRHVLGTWRFWQPTPHFLVPTCVGIVLIALILVTLRWATAPLRIATAVLSLVWFPVNAPVEGPVLVRFAPSHGLTAADLIGIAGLIVAVAAPVLHRRFGSRLRPAAPARTRQRL